MVAAADTADRSRVDEWEEVHDEQQQTIEQQQLTIDLLLKRLNKAEAEQREINEIEEQRMQRLEPLKEKYREPTK